VRATVMVMLSAVRGFEFANASWFSPYHGLVLGLTLAVAVNPLLGAVVVVVDGATVVVAAGATVLVVPAGATVVVPDAATVVVPDAATVLLPAVVTPVVVLLADAVPWPALAHGDAESAATGVAVTGAATMTIPPTMVMA
jgi:hypothetical protein